MMEQGLPLSVTVLREVSGTSTRLFQYSGNPREEELETVLEHVKRLAALDGDGTRIDVILGGDADPPKRVWLTDALRSLEQAYGHRVVWSIQ